MWQTCALLIALATAAQGERPVPQPAEPARAFLCRAREQPRARACAGRCEQAYGTPDAADARFDCLTTCTRRALGAAADCRRAAPAPGLAVPGDALAAAPRRAR